MQNNWPSIKDMEKKVRKEIRLKRLISKGDTLIILEDGGARTQALTHVLNEIIKDPSISIEVVTKIPKLSANMKLVLPYTIEVEARLFIEEFTKDSFRDEPFMIKPLIRVSYGECKNYCDKKGISYVEKVVVSDGISNFLDRLDKKYSVLNSIIKTEESLKK